MKCVKIVVLQVLSTNLSIFAEKIGFQQNCDFEGREKRGIRHTHIDSLGSGVGGGGRGCFEGLDELRGRGEDDRINRF